jgi:hypothetical protein
MNFYHSIIIILHCFPTTSDGDKKKVVKGYRQWGDIETSCSCCLDEKIGGEKSSNIERRIEESFSVLQ